MKDIGKLALGIVLGVILTVGSQWLFFLPTTEATNAVPGRYRLMYETGVKGNQSYIKQVIWVDTATGRAKLYHYVKHSGDWKFVLSKRQTLPHALLE